MTKEQAIMYLRSMQGICSPQDRMAKEAVRMATDALSAEVVQGEWTIDEYGIYHCPFCQAINNTVYKNFCPNCGARMKGGGSE